MQLGELVGLDRLANKKIAKTEIAGLTADSKAVKPSYLFAALPGTAHDGAAYIDEAIANGAAAILTHPHWQKTFPNSKQAQITKTPFVVENNPRRLLSHLAARFYPHQPETICAVTGTNGKTSVANFSQQIWTKLGLRAASMGTLGVVSPESFIPLGHTTPDPVRIHQILDGLTLSGVDHVALEASSHGLAQYRLDGVKIKAAAFTNLTRDHLDYHESAEDYFYAKMRLFGELMEPGCVAVLDTDCDVFGEIEQLCWARGLCVFSVGEKGTDIKITGIKPTVDGQTISIKWRGQSLTIKLPLVGSFQASNALLAAGLCIATGADASKVFNALETLEGVEGRMEHVGSTADGASIFIDYAHTPDGLETVLAALRSHTMHNLWVVVGCGGDRDQGKRPQMARIASDFADHVIITDDNPRTENAEKIRADMLAGIPDGAPPVEEIGDRSQAIAKAVSGLTSGDVLIVAGKGHETGQIVSDQVLPFSDKEEVMRNLQQLGGGNA